jgi:hypothetical protein
LGVINGAPDIATTSSDLPVYAAERIFCDLLAITLCDEDVVAIREH